MRTPLNIDDFESYLEEEVNQHRMYPSDHVWRNIQQDLHGYKKWPALTVITLFVISALVAGTLLLKPAQQAKVIAQQAAAPAKTTEGAQTKTGGQQPDNIQQHFSPEHITEQTIASVAGDIDGAIQHAFADFQGVENTLVQAGNDGNFSNEIPGAPVAAGNAVVIAVAPSGRKTGLITATLPASGETEATGINYDNAAFTRGPDLNWMAAFNFDNSQVPDRFYFTKGVWKTVYKRIFYKSAERLPSGLPADAGYIYTEPSEAGLANAPVHNSAKAQAPRPGRFDLQVYLAPSLSYLISQQPAAPAKTNTSFPVQSPAGTGYVTGINSLARIQTVTGYEGGVALGYKVTRSVTLRAGLQLDVRQYDIEAAGVSPAATAAQSQAAPGNNPALAGGGADVAAPPAQNLQAGKQQAAEISGTYYQVALPVGIDWRAWANGRFSLSLAASVQPAYKVAEGPVTVAFAGGNISGATSLMRTWNINSAIAALFSYSAGKYKWQLGPQLSYGLLPALKGSYPLSAHVFEYGIKVGVVRSLP